LLHDLEATELPVGRHRPIEVSNVQCAVSTYRLHTFSDDGSRHCRWLHSLAAECLVAVTYRDREREGRPHAELTRDPDLPAVQLYELPAKSQTQPCTFRLLVRRPHLPELFEDGSLILWGNAHPRIGHGHLGHAVHHPRPRLHAPPLAS